MDKSEDVVRLSGNVKGDVYVYQTNQWILIKDVKLPEGWFAGPGPK